MFQHEQPFLHTGYADNQILYTHRENGLVLTSVLTLHDDGRVTEDGVTYASIQEFVRLKGVFPLDTINV
jgi:hypothetical protein